MGNSGALSNYTGIITLGGGAQHGTLSVNGTVSNNITLAGAGGWVATSGTLSGSITGSAPLVKIDDNWTTLTNTANTYSGGTIVANGVLSMGTTSSLAPETSRFPLASPT